MLERQVPLRNGRHDKLVFISLMIVLSSLIFLGSITLDDTESKGEICKPGPKGVPICFNQDKG